MFVRIPLLLICSCFYVRRAGIAHRDIKGANVLLGAGGVIKLADFGASKRMDVAAAHAAATGTQQPQQPPVTGTPLAPRTTPQTHASSSPPAAAAAAAAAALALMPAVDGSSFFRRQSSSRLGAVAGAAGGGDESFADSASARSSFDEDSAVGDEIDAPAISTSSGSVVPAGTTPPVYALAAAASTQLSSTGPASTPTVPHVNRGDSSSSVHDSGEMSMYAASSSSSAAAAAAPSRAPITRTRSRKQLDRISALRGTAFWMAPEVIRQEMLQRAEAWKKADIWSVGCTVLEMFTGKAPWAGQFVNPHVAMFHIATQDIAPTIPPHVPAAARDFMALCFRRDPASRPDVAALMSHPFVASGGLTTPFEVAADSDGATLSVPATGSLEQQLSRAETSLLLPMPSSASLLGGSVHGGAGGGLPPRPSSSGGSSSTRLGLGGAGLSAASASSASPAVLTAIAAGMWGRRQPSTLSTSLISAAASSSGASSTPSTPWWGSAGISAGPLILSDDDAAAAVLRAAGLRGAAAVAGSSDVGAADGDAVHPQPLLQALPSAVVAGVTAPSAYRANATISHEASPSPGTDSDQIAPVAREFGDAAASAVSAARVRMGAGDSEYHPPASAAYSAASDAGDAMPRNAAHAGEPVLFDAGAPFPLPPHLSSAASMSGGQSGRRSTPAPLARRPSQPSASSSSNSLLASSGSASRLLLLQTQTTPLSSRGSDGGGSGAAVPRPQGSSSRHARRDSVSGSAPATPAAGSGGSLMSSPHNLDAEDRLSTLRSISRGGSSFTEVLAQHEGSSSSGGAGSGHGTTHRSVGGTTTAVRLVIASSVGAAAAVDSGDAFSRLASALSAGSSALGGGAHDHGDGSGSGRRTHSGGRLLPSSSSQYPPTGTTAAAAAGDPFANVVDYHLGDDEVDLQDDDGDDDADDDEEEANEMRFLAESSSSSSSSSSSNNIGLLAAAGVGLLRSVVPLLQFPTRANGTTTSVVGSRLTGKGAVSLSVTAATAPIEPAPAHVDVRNGAACEPLQSQQQQHAPASYDVCTTTGADSTADLDLAADDDSTPMGGGASTKQKSASSELDPSAAAAALSNRASPPGLCRQNSETACTFELIRSVSATISPVQQLGVAVEGVEGCLSADSVPLDADPSAGIAPVATGSAGSSPRAHHHQRQQQHVLHVQQPDVDPALLVTAHHRRAVDAQLHVSEGRVSAFPLRDFRSPADTTASVPPLPLLRRTAAVVAAAAATGFKGSAPSESSADGTSGRSPLFALVGATSPPPTPSIESGSRRLRSTSLLVSVCATGSSHSDGASTGTAAGAVTAAPLSVAIGGGEALSGTSSRRRRAETSVGIVLARRSTGSEAVAPAVLSAEVGPSARGGGAAAAAPAGTGDGDRDSNDPISLLFPVGTHAHRHHLEAMHLPPAPVPVAAAAVTPAPAAQLATRAGSGAEAATPLGRSSFSSSTGGAPSAGATWDFAGAAAAASSRPGSASPAAESWSGAVSLHLHASSSVSRPPSPLPRFQPSVLSTSTGRSGGWAAGDDSARSASIQSAVSVGAARAQIPSIERSAMGPPSAAAAAAPVSRRAERLSEEDASTAPHSPASPMHPVRHQHGTSSSTSGGSSGRGVMYAARGSLAAYALGASPPRLMEAHPDAASIGGAAAAGSPLPGSSLYSAATATASSGVPAAAGSPVASMTMLGAPLTFDGAVGAPLRYTRAAAAHPYLVISATTEGQQQSDTLNSSSSSSCSSGSSYNSSFDAAPRISMWSSSSSAQSAAAAAPTTASSITPLQRTVLLPSVRLSRASSTGSERGGEASAGPDGAPPLITPSTRASAPGTSSPSVGPLQAVSLCIAIPHQAFASAAETPLSESRAVAAAVAVAHARRVEAIASPTAAAKTHLQHGRLPAMGQSAYVLPWSPLPTSAYSAQQQQQSLQIMHHQPQQVTQQQGLASPFAGLISPVAPLLQSGLSRGAAAPPTYAASPLASTPSMTTPVGAVSGGGSGERASGFSLPRVGSAGGASSSSGGGGARSLVGLSPIARFSTQSLAFRDAAPERMEQQRHAAAPDLTTVESAAAPATSTSFSLPTWRRGAASSTRSDSSACSSGISPRQWGSAPTTAVSSVSSGAAPTAVLQPPTSRTTTVGSFFPASASGPPTVLQLPSASSSLEVPPSRWTAAAPSPAPATSSWETKPHATSGGGGNVNGGGGSARVSTSRDAVLARVCGSGGADDDFDTIVDSRNSSSRPSPPLASLQRVGTLLPLPSVSESSGEVFLKSLGATEDRVMGGVLAPPVQSLNPVEQPQQGQQQQHVVRRYNAAPHAAAPRTSHGLEDGVHSRSAPSSPPLLLRSFLAPDAAPPHFGSSGSSSCGENASITGAAALGAATYSGGSSGGGGLERGGRAAVGSGEGTGHPLALHWHTPPSPAPAPSPAAAGCSARGRLHTDAPAAFGSVGSTSVGRAGQPASTAAATAWVVGPEPSRMQVAGGSAAQDDSGSGHLGKSKAAVALQQPQLTLAHPPLPTPLPSVLPYHRHALAGACLAGATAESTESGGRGGGRGALSSFSSATVASPVAFGGGAVLPPVMRSSTSHSPLMSPRMMTASFAESALSVGTSTPSGSAITVARVYGSGAGAAQQQQQQQHSASGSVSSSSFFSFSAVPSGGPGFGAIAGGSVELTSDDGRQRRVSSSAGTVRSGSIGVGGDVPRASIRLGALPGAADASQSTTYASHGGGGGAAVPASVPSLTSGRYSNSPAPSDAAAISGVTTSASSAGLLRRQASDGGDGASHAHGTPAAQRSLVAAAGQRVMGTPH